MQIRGHIIVLFGALALALGCTHPPEPQEVPPEAEPINESSPVPEEEAVDRSAEIQARNREILERLEREELLQKQQRAAAPEAERAPSPATEPTPAPSGMEEMRARADELEPRVAAIGRIADRVDDNYRRYVDACYEKYTAATASPQTGTVYYEPYQPLAISNETTPYCRELWSDIGRDAQAVELAMRALSEEARRRGVLPGHLRDLTRKYRLDRDGWRH